ncbi:MAG: multiheme c-type cytochrome [Acidobacteriota bacterium]
MEKRDDGFYQTGYEKDASGSRSRTERFDLVLGSGRKGQTYLYWKDGFLYQMPVSHVTGADRWVNSPGFVDGKVHFDRPIIPRCLECHTTSFRLEAMPSKPRYSDDYVLGIACETCHGLGSRHVQHHNSEPQEQQGRFIVNPARFSRDRKVDQCALCHSGIGQSRTPPFSYRPGDRLQDHLLPDRETVLAPDVHGNQIGLLRTSRCFIASGTLDCSTCHDVHRPQRDLAQLSARCVGCHAPERCGVFATAGRRIEENCIDCHMPNRPSRMISIQTDAGDLSPQYRSHAIGIYHSETGPVLRSLLRGKP